VREYELNKYIDNPQLVENKIKSFLEERTLKIEKFSAKEIEGHLLKSDHNLNYQLQTDQNCKAILNSAFPN